jgi:hypothetical protein
MTNTMQDPEFEAYVQLVIASLRLLADINFRRSIEFPVPPGKTGKPLVTPLLGGYEVTFGGVWDGGTRGWYASIRDAAEAVALHRQTPRRVR